MSLRMMDNGSPIPNDLTVDARFTRRLLIGAAVFSGLGLLAFTVDLNVSAAFLGEAGPIWSAGRRLILQLCKPAESFGNGLGALLILVALFAADPRWRKRWLPVAAAVYGSGIAANVCKLLVARTRPGAFFDSAAGQFHGSVGESFQAWLPLAKMGYPGQSFPSGHTAVAAALAICLCTRWPRASWAFISLAALTALQRIAFGHHYLSDCLFSAAVACTVAAACRAVGRIRAQAGKQGDTQQSTEMLRSAA